MKIKFVVYLIIILLIYSCAQIVPLTGGEKDETPPKELQVIPKNESINFNNKTIIIEFDEFIKLEQLNAQLIISPVMNPKPEISVKGKKLIIQLKAQLSANTTYSINFGNAVVDITENNAIPNFKYVFSTGNYLDSLSFSGSVVDAFQLTTVDKVYVLLYDELEDSVPMKQLPRYVAITDKKGDFSITNVAKGTYKIFALQDINANYLYDLPNEKIAFLNEPIQLDSSLTHQHLFLFEEKQDHQYLKKVEHKEVGKVVFYLNQPSNNITITTNVKEKIRWYEEERNPTNDTIIHWLLNVGNIKEADYYISEEKKMLDTANVSFIASTKLKDTLINLQLNITNPFDLKKQLQILSPRPFTLIDTNLIVLLEDSVSVKIKLTKNLAHSRIVNIDYPFKEKTNYVLKIFPAAFQDVLGLKNDTITSLFTTKSEADYGTIFLKLTPNFDTPYVLNLYKGNALIKEYHSEGNNSIKFDFLLPGDYNIHLFIDENKNKKWDTGDYLKKKQPEEMIHYQKPITIRANWDNEIIWNINR